MQQIDLDIGRQYDLEIKKFIPYRDAYILDTTRGRKLLKKEGISPKRILFIHGAKEHLFNNSFQHIDRFICTVDGKPFLETNHGCFTLTDFIEGSECNFDVESDVIMATRALAQLHAASRGYKSPSGAFSRDELGKMPIIFKKRLNEIIKIKKIAGKGKTKFDYMVLHHVDYFYNQGKEALEELLKSEYSLLVDDVRKQGSFCHHDFTHHNIIISNGYATILNFTNCCYELKIYDVANLIRRKMRKCNWDVKEAAKIIDIYSRYENLSNSDLQIMLYILQFPQKFWRVVNQYYNSRKGWSENLYITKLKEITAEIPYHKKFLDSYVKTFLQA